MSNTASVNYALSDGDIKSIMKTFGYPARIYTYDDLSKYNNLDELMPNAYDYVILHIPVKSLSSGHWVAIMKAPHKDSNKDSSEYNFFDSYGKKPDRQLYYSNKKVRGELFDEPYLSYLLNKAKKNSNKVVFNRYAYQDDDKQIQTCGKFVLLRILYFLQHRDISGNAFLKYMKSLKKEKFQGYDYDQIVAVMMDPANPEMY